jgi:hypothetical protein
MQTLAPSSTRNSLRRVAHYVRRAEHQWIWLLIALLALVLVLLLPARGSAFGI